MSDIPKPSRPFDGDIQRLFKDSTPSPLPLNKQAAGAPNVLLVMLDDVGFGTCSTFGGPIPTPVSTRLLRRFEVQPIPPQPCVLHSRFAADGRNHHSVHMGGITKSPTVPVLRQRDSARDRHYCRNTETKWLLHRLFWQVAPDPAWEHHPAGPFDRGPTGMGFERFYGIIGAEASHWEPAVYDQTTPVEPHLGRDKYHLTEDLAEKAIEWMAKQQVSATDKPFFCYFAPAAVHARTMWPQSGLTSSRVSLIRVGMHCAMRYISGSLLWV